MDRLGHNTAVSSPTADTTPDVVGTDGHPTPTDKRVVPLGDPVDEEG